MSPMLRRASVCAAAVLLGSACTGSIPAGRAPGDSPSRTDPSSPGAPGASGNQAPAGDRPGTALPPPAPGSSGRLRLLTRAQLENSLRDLLGADVVIPATEGDTVADGFASVGATYTTISPRGIEQLEAAVLGVLTPLFADPARRTPVLGCTPAGLDDQACVRRFITGFGQRAWRRPLSPAEVDRYSR